MNIMIKTCKNCGLGTFRELIIQHSIKTRNELKNVVNIENLPIFECNVCGTRELPAKSEEKIETVKQLIKRDMKRIAEAEQNKVNDHSYKELFTTIFQRNKAKKHAN